MKKHLKLIGFGFLTWLIPFVVAIPFYSQSGELMVNQDFFKSVMIVIGSLTGAVMLLLYYKMVERDYLREGVIIGLVWIAINYLLDFVVLLPMSGMSMNDYFLQIGLRYFNMPITTITMGLILKHKLRNINNAKS